MPDPARPASTPPAALLLFVFRLPPVPMRRVALSVLLLAVLPAPVGGDASPGVVSTWVWHTDPLVGPSAAPTYGDLLRALDDDVRIFVLASKERDLRRFASLTGSPARKARKDHRIRYLLTDNPVSSWARDRYVLFERRGRACALLPRPQSVDPSWRGDLDLPGLLASGPLRALEVTQTELVFEGGNVIVTDDHVIVGESVLVESADFFDGLAERVVSELEARFGRKVVVVGDSETPPPHDHIDMFLTAIDSRTLLLGDPGMALEGPDLPGVGTIRRATQLEYVPVYEKISARLEEAGFRVRRIPIVHGEDANVVATWNNAVVERRGDGLRAFVPCYGVPRLDRRAYECWRGAGVEVVPIRSDAIIAHGGAVRCLSNVLRARRR